jgi:hypothetical protein
LIVDRLQTITEPLQNAAIGFEIFFEISLFEKQNHSIYKDPSAFFTLHEFFLRHQYFTTSAPKVSFNSSKLFQ